MHGRFRFLFSPDGVAPGTPAAPSTPAPAPTPGPDVAALVAAAVKAEVGPLLEQLHAARGETAAEKTARAKAEADTVAAAAAKGTADEQIKSLTARFNDANTRAALSSSADRYTYTSPVAKEQALIAFRATHPAEVNAANEVVAKVAGKDVPLGSAFDAFMAGPAGALYRAATAQPGQAVPPGTAPPASKKSVRELSRDEFAALLRSGVKGKLTNDARSPEVTIRRTSIARVDQRRAELLSQIAGK